MQSIKNLASAAFGSVPEDEPAAADAPFAPTMLAAPTGGVVQSRRDSIAPGAGGERNMGSMWSRVQ